MDSDGDLGRRLDALARYAPGVGGLVLRDGRLAALAVRGRRFAGRRDGVAMGDAWHIGSCTKAMTATLLARLQRRGLIDLGAGLREALPDVPMHPAFAATSLRAVLRHEAGIRRDPHRSVFARLRESRASLPDQRRHVAALALADRPHRRAGYSNLGYIVLGAVGEAATGLSWEEAMTREVFAPLGMKTAGFGPPPLPGPVGHVRRGNRWRARPPGPWADNPGLYGPAGRVHLSLTDWARFAAVHLEAGPPGYLPAALVREMQRRGARGHAAGWERGTMADGAPFLRHVGSNTMWFADMVLVPEARIGAAIVCNAFDPALRAQVLRATEGLIEWASDM